MSARGSSAAFRRPRALNASLLGALLFLLACESQGRAPPGQAASAKAAAPSGAQGRASSASPSPLSAPTDVTAQDYPMPPLPRARVTLTDAYGYKHLVDAEVAATSASRTRGLMWRSALPEGTGMLFVFPAEDWLSFWMKNTLIPLDLIFLSRDLVIVGIVEQAEPKTLTPRGPRAMARYVLEVPGGWAAKRGLTTGLKVSVEGLHGIAVGP